MRLRARRIPENFTRARRSLSALLSGFGRGASGPGPGAHTWIGEPPHPSRRAHVLIRGGQFCLLRRQAEMHTEIRLAGAPSASAISAVVLGPCSCKCCRIAARVRGSVLTVACLAADQPPASRIPRCPPTNRRNPGRRSRCDPACARSSPTLPPGPAPDCSAHGR